MTGTACMSVLMLLGCNRGPLLPCVDEDVSAGINVIGTFDYSGSWGFPLSGTITFEQDGDVVRVVDTTYDVGNDRRLMGEGTLVGNVLEITLVPQNGDTDYRADITFVFGSQGRDFCVLFSDTNGDAGDLGSYRGVRQLAELQELFGSAGRSRDGIEP